MVDVILGLQWGDEGKGKIVDYFARNYQVVARFQGGPNAGHTLYVNDKKVVLHQIPSGIFHDGIINVIGNGVVLDPVTLKKECETVASFGVDLKKNLFISERAHLIIPTHRALDKAAELAKGKDKIGSTLKGIGPTYMDKTGRNGLRVGDLLQDDFPTLYEQLKTKHRHLLDGYQFHEDISEWEKDFFEAISFVKELNIIKGEYFINDKIQEGQKILAEGAQGTMLDIDFGTFPFVTSSNTISAGVCNGLGIAPQKIGEIIGISKAYCTRVGSGPFPTELEDATGEKLRKMGQEFGATTGRPRRCGWIDLVALDYACMINGVTKLVITKADVLDSFSTLSLCTAYKIDGNNTKEMPLDLEKKNPVPQYTIMEGWQADGSKAQKFDKLPVSMQQYMKFIADYLQRPVTHISNGPGREQIIEVN